MKFSRKWAMPSKNTFDIKPIKKFILNYTNPELIILDPFANKNKIGTITNDLDPQFKTTYNLDALEFLKLMPNNSADLILYDPPYSPRQVSECYKKMGKTVNMQTTQSSFWGNLKKEIQRVTKPKGIVLSFAWNSNGIGKTKGFNLVEVLIVAHGGNHNDTICVAEQKELTLF